MPNDVPVIELRGVSKHFGDAPAVEDIDLQVHPGEFLTLLGPSGCGKTTILRLIAGFETASAGTLCISGRDVGSLPPEARDVNTVFQSYALFPHMTVFDNVAFGLRMQRKSAPDIRRDVAEALRLVKLDGLENRMPSSLSGGQQQRVAIARAIASRPLVLLLDEPLSALDHRLRKQMQLEIKHLHNRLGITFVLVTHDQEEAFSMSDRVAVMRRGRIVQQGTPLQIYENPESLFVARFVGDTNVLDAEVLERRGEDVLLDLEGTRCLLRSRRSFAPGQKVHVLLRPEDFQMETVRDLQTEPDLAERYGRNVVLRGRVEETVYKGATYDVAVVLASGARIMVTEFFNEDSETVYFRPGDEVAVTWVSGWEVVLPHEGRSL